jgi:hypothetical protein
MVRSNHLSCFLVTDISAISMVFEPLFNVLAMLTQTGLSPIPMRCQNGHGGALGVLQGTSEQVVKMIFLKLWGSTSKQKFGLYNIKS